MRKKTMILEKPGARACEHACTQKLHTPTHVQGIRKKERWREKERETVVRPPVSLFELVLPRVPYKEHFLMTPSEPSPRQPNGMENTD